MIKRFKLEPGMFGDERQSIKALGSGGSWDLRFGQNRADCFVRNANWYNGRGEKIGRGDLSLRDLYGISCSILDDEIFIIVPGHELPRSDKEVAGKAEYAVMFGGKYFLVNSNGQRGQHRVRAMDFEIIPHTSLLGKMQLPATA